MTIFSLGKEAMSDEHYINLLFFTPCSSRCCFSAMPGKVDLKRMYTKITDGGGGGHDLANVR